MTEKLALGCIARFASASLALIFTSPHSTPVEAADWPQWMGPNRDGISQESGFSKEWPQDGPRILWRMPAGPGFSGISIAGGRLYTMYNHDNAEFVVCMNADTGEEIWRYQSDDEYIEHEGGDGPRSTPTVVGNRLYGVSTRGNLFALGADEGEVLWSRDLRADYDSTTPFYGFCTSPLVEGDMLLMEVGGPAGKGLVAFDRHTGEEVWFSQRDMLGYSSPIAITAAGIRQIVFLTGWAAVSVAAEDGRMLWRHTWTAPPFNAATPVFIQPNRIFVSSGYNKGCVLLEMTKRGKDGVAVEEVWSGTSMRNRMSTSVLYDDHLYGFDNTTLKCINARTGDNVWRGRGFGSGSLILADGHLIVLGENGRLALIEATPTGFAEQTGAQVLSGTCLTVPTLANGKLYIRNFEEIVCLDLKDEI